ncbi:hypothetical protein [Cohnella silvisoli]|uniref:Uncharacterized protein n=1 Tax=Cohnella silvisoli TaxID=2873699 RepID=A0ABV1KQB3_9BACL|nr:hypothetical protein [Cohnella silvisoli]MCD9022126.1 hypothetical protein [Cohnella silvisoli]
MKYARMGLQMSVQMGENKVSDHSVPETQHQVTLQSDDDRKINHYEKVKEDVRSEIKMRIKQRDYFAIQLVIMLVLLCAVGFADKGYTQVLIVAPLLSVFYTMLILHSYRKHDALARYARDVLDPQLAELCQIDPAHEWHSFDFKTAKSGVLRVFYLWAMWVVCLGSMTFLWFNAASGFRQTISIFAGVYILAMLYITLSFMGDAEVRRKAKHKGSPHNSGVYLS